MADYPHYDIERVRHGTRRGRARASASSTDYRSIPFATSREHAARAATATATTTATRCHSQLSTLSSHSPRLALARLPLGDSAGRSSQGGPGGGGSCSPPASGLPPLRVGRQRRPFGHQLMRRGVAGRGGGALAGCGGARRGEARRARAEVLLPFLASLTTTERSLGQQRGERRQPGRQQGPTTLPPPLPPLPPAAPLPRAPLAAEH